MSQTKSQTGYLPIEEFGRKLLRKNDLDPVYVVLWEAMSSGDLDQDQLRKWLVAYWCFYHSGTASWATDSTDYWGAMERAASSKDFPRCHERRHFRGAAASRSVEYLRGRGLDGLFGDLEAAGPTVAAKMAAVQRWVGFGPWIAFKVADMYERLGLGPVAFDEGAMFLFDSPRKGAERLWAEVEGGPGTVPDSVGTEGSARSVGAWAVDYVLTHLASRRILISERRGAEAGRRSGLPLAPPCYERPINVQEVETILCKWKSHTNGRYHVGEDVAALRAGLLRFCRSRTAQHLLKAGKRGGLWL